MTTLSRRTFLAAAAMAPSACASTAPPEARALAVKLRDLYARRGRDAERWGGRTSTVEISGVAVPRRLAYRDDRLFPAACAALLEGPVSEARLGAWLLEGTRPAHREAAVRAARAHLGHGDPVVRFQLLKSLLELGDSATVMKATAGSAIAHDAGLRLMATAEAAARAPRASTPGACFWFEGHEGDFGVAQFRKLARFGVREVSIHTFDPLQQGKHNPVLREARRSFSVPDLTAWVRAAEEHSIEVTFKPHLELGFRRLSEAERKILSAGSESERQGLQAAIEKERAAAGWHGDIEMKSDADWRLWFQGYSAYLLGHARSAAEAGASAFCVGREIDRTVLGREDLWRALIAQVREVFQGRLVYSAHHDTFDRLPIWDALDMIGVSAYPQVETDLPPRMSAVREGWSAFVARCDALASRVGRPLAWTEVGYPAVDTAAREPWREDTSEANVILQSELLGVALEAAKRSRTIRGTCVWLWEGVSDPPFRDRSFTIQDKPAAFAMAAAYRG